MTLESTIEGHLVKRVEKEIGGIALKGAVPGRRFIDRICILPGGRVVFFELKKPKGGRRSAHQEETIERLVALGHEAVFAKTKEEIDVVLYGRHVTAGGRLLYAKSSHPVLESTPRGLIAYAYKS